MLASCRKFAVLLPAIAGFAAVARGDIGTFTRNDYVNKSLIKTAQELVGNSSTISVAYYGYDIDSIAQRKDASGNAAGECKWSINADNKVTFSSFEFSATFCAVDVHLTPWVYALNYALNASDAQWNSGYPSVVQANYPTSVSAYDGSSCVNNGYTLQSWNTEKNGSGTTVELGQSLTMGSPPLSNDTRSVTLYAQWQVNDYVLRLRPGAGIAKIHYKTRSSSESSLQWRETAADLDVCVAYGTDWQVYATAINGYSYTEYSENNPKAGIMTTAGDLYAPVASAGKIVVAFNGNGNTSGTMAKQEFTVDVPQFLNENQYHCAYKVTYNPNAAGAVVNPASDDAEYPFLNWNNQADGLGAHTYANQASVTNPCDATGGEVMLYAQWSSAVASVTLPTPTYDDKHICAGWYAEAACTTKVGDPGASYTPTNNITLYAKWTAQTFTVTFCDDGEVLSTQPVEYEKSATPPDTSSCVKDYYKQGGWDTDAWKSVTDDLTVNLVWTPKQYRLKLYRAHSVQDTTCVISDDYCGKGEDWPRKIEFGDPRNDYGFKTKTGHTFDCWSENAEGSGDSYEVGTEVSYFLLDEVGSGKEEVDFYAIWTPNHYTVKFNKGVEAATGTMADQAFTYDQAQALTANAFKYDGQDFLGWTRTASASTVDYAEGQTVSNLTAKANDTVNLYAVWSNYHYVRFDRNGATNESKMALQKFSGAETNVLSASVYGKVGYTFAGWATNTVDAESLRVTYTNCQSVAFPLAQPNETNILYAVWATNHYSIAFNPGTNGVYGTMAELTNCVYDSEVTLSCGYTNYYSRGLLGWAREPGASTPEYPVSTPSPTTQGSATVVSNLTAAADGHVTLYAVWSGLGELSEAVGLANAVLVSSNTLVAVDTDKVAWRVKTNYPLDGAGDPTAYTRAKCIALEWTPVESTGAEINGTWTLMMKVVGAGDLNFSCYWEKYNNGEFELLVDGEKKLELADEMKWSAYSLSLTGAGEHTVVWQFNNSIRSGSDDIDVLCLNDIRWSPGVEVTPGETLPTYASEAEAKTAAESTRVLPPNDAVSAACAAAGVDYNALFQVRTVETATPGTWTLAIELQPAVSNQVQLAVDAATTNLVPAFQSAVAGSAVYVGMPLTVTLPMQAGLYYGLAATNQVEGLRLAMPTNWVLGTGAAGGQSLSVGAPAAASGFFNIHSTATPPDKH